MADWKKVIVSGSAVSQLENDANYLIQAQDGAVLTGSFSGSFVGTTDLPDLTSGNGLTGGPYDGSTTKTFSIVPDGTTLTVGAGGVKVTQYGITSNELNTSVAGNGLVGGSGTALSVNVDNSSIEIVADTLNVKAAGITNAMLAGSIVNTKLVNDSVTGTTEVELGATASTIAGLTLTGVEASGSFSGSFQGDGSAITGIASTLSTAGETGTGEVALKTQTLTIAAGEGINTVASGTTVTISGEDASASNKGVAKFSSNNFTVTAGDVALSQDVTIAQDLTVTRNLTVMGTASFQHTTNLDVTDRFIRMASGSSTAGDGGIAIQQVGSSDSEAFGFDSAVTRWGVTGSFDASQNLMVPDAFMATVIEGAASDPEDVILRYKKRGNIFAAADQSIWIYS